MGALTPKALIRDHEREDAEFGDELEPGLAKAADDGGVHGGFTVSQYSGVMNPPKLPYASGIPGWVEPAVKTTSGQKTAGISPEVDAAQTKSTHYTLGGLGAGALVGGLIGRRAGIPLEGAVTGGLAGSLLGAMSQEGNIARAREEARARRQTEYDATLDKVRLLGHGIEAVDAPEKVGMLNPASQLSKAKAVGAPKLSTPPGPSIAQISKPKGYGTPMSGAKKGNNTI